MRHICHEDTIWDFLGDFGDTVKIRDFHKGRVANEDDFGLFFEGFRLELGVVNVAVGGDAVADEIINLCGAGDWGTVGEVTAGGETHGEDFVAGIAPGEVNRFVSVGARVRLNVGMIGMEELTSASDGEAFDTIDINLATIIAVIW